MLSGCIAPVAAQQMPSHICTCVAWWKPSIESEFACVRATKAEKLLGSSDFATPQRWGVRDARASVQPAGSRVCALDVLAVDRAAHANVIKPLGEGAPPWE